ncbi:MAG TPA: PilW family protein [Thiobacillus sp.]
MAPTLIASGRAARSRGLSLIELMIAIAIGMVVVAALLALYLNVTRTNNEMAKMNRQIENGRFAMQVLQDDVVLAGFWGSFVPQFDDLTGVAAPLDVPTALPDPCLTYNAANWNDAYLANLIGIPVQGSAGTCTLTSQKPNTDVLVVRHAMNCVAGVGNCESDVAGKLYFQSSQCENELSTLAQGGTATTITLDAGSSSTTDFYKNAIIRIVSGPGAGQSRMITAYNGGSKTATVNPAWATIPDNSSKYAFGLGYVLNTGGFIFHKRDCTTAADKLKFVSNVYYIRDYAVTPGDGIPTLMQSAFDSAGGNLAQQPAQALIEGIEGFRVMYGIDSFGKTGAPENYLAAVAWADPTNKVTPTNRGDGIAEGSYVDATNVTCNSATDCKAANVVAVRIYVLARSQETTPGYTDTKTYQLGDVTKGPFNDGYKRHVFSTTVRLVNPAGRRDTP